MVSFSLTMGMTPISSNVDIVLHALRYCVLYKRHPVIVNRSRYNVTSARSCRVRRIWAIRWSNNENKLSYMEISRPCPTAATAYFSIWYDMLYKNKYTCFLAISCGFLSKSNVLNPVPIAPLLTSTTWCPDSRNLMHVSTTLDKVARSGRCEISSQILVVPSFNTIFSENACCDSDGWFGAVEPMLGKCGSRRAFQTSIRFWDPSHVLYWPEQHRAMSSVLKWMGMVHYFHNFIPHFTWLGTRQIIRGRTMARCKRALLWPRKRKSFPVISAVKLEI